MANTNVPCTFFFTENQHSVQYWFNCYTCSNSSNQGVCYACAQVCHKGHKLGNKEGELGLQKCNHTVFYCDCGAGEIPGKCQCLPASTVRDLILGDTSVDYQLIRAATEGNRFSVLSPVNIKMALELAGEVFDCTELTMPFIKAKYTQVDDPSLSVACGLFGFGSSKNPKVLFDWAENQDNSMNNINNFVSIKTNGMIKDMLTSEPMGPVVVSALYFKGSWVRPFKPHNTVKNWEFKGLNGKVMVDMMRSFPGEYDMNHREIKTKFIQTHNLKSLVLPYVGDRFVAVLTLPLNEKETMHNIFRAPQFYDEWSQHLKLNNVKSLSVQYFVPKFKKEFTYKNMPAILKSAGFDFDKFSARSSVSEIIHKVVIDVDEIGTTASAATTLVAKGGPAVDKYWYGDQPFAFSIVDVTTASVVFGGIIDFSC